MVRILVIRLRQMGDAILATSLLNTLRRSLPDAQIDFVLNERIAPLFEGHPAISNIITMSPDELHSMRRYVARVWRIVHQEHYDAIIDLRSTVNTQLFALFSLRTPVRVARRKWYTLLASNHTVRRLPSDAMIDHDLAFAAPLGRFAPIQYDRQFTLHITEQEMQQYGDYLRAQGVDLQRPVLLANVTAKLANKVWAEDKMVQVLTDFMTRHPDWQILFNYAPGAEEQNARCIYTRLGSPSQVLIDVQAHSSRELAALGHYVTCFFGNEGGARHVVHAMGCPSLVICAPGNKKHVWIPQNDVPAQGIAPSDFADERALSQMSRQQQYDLINPQFVSDRLNGFIQEIGVE